MYKNVLNSGRILQSYNYYICSVHENTQNLAVDFPMWTVVLEPVSIHDPIHNCAILGYMYI